MKLQTSRRAHDPRRYRGAACLATAFALAGALTPAPASAVPAEGASVAQPSGAHLVTAPLAGGVRLDALTSVAAGHGAPGVALNAYAALPRITSEMAAAARAQEARAAADRASRAAARTPKGIARSLMAGRGWGADQFSCLDKLWTKESNWTVTADNPTSSAYGIPQALPGRRMASEGKDWKTNPATQIRWGLGYIDERYGSPCKAWAHSRAHNWY